MGRVPMALQRIFLESNAGGEVDKPPEDGTAYRVYLRPGNTRPKMAPARTGSMKKALASMRKKMMPFNRRRSETSTTVASSDCSGSPISTQSARSGESVSLASSQHDRANGSARSAERRRLSGKSAKSSEPSQTPQEVLETLMEARGYPFQRFDTIKTAHYNRPTPYQIACYDTNLLKTLITKEQDEEALTMFIDCGMSLNACNRHCESLLQYACRKGYSQLVEVFVFHGACLTQADDQGRTILHEVCMSAKKEASMDIFDLIMQHEPHLMLMADKNGAVPLEYIPASRFRAWNGHIRATFDKYWPVGLSNVNAKKKKKKNAIAPFTIPGVVFDAPNSAPIPDPKDRLSTIRAAMVASGCTSPRSVIQQRDQVSESGHDSHTTWSGSQTKFDVFEVNSSNNNNSCNKKNEEKCLLGETSDFVTDEESESSYSDSDSEIGDDEQEEDYQDDEDEDEDEDSSSSSYSSSGEESLCSGTTMFSEQYLGRGYDPLRELFKSSVSRD